MGVPKFFAWLTKKYKHITYFDNKKHIDSLFLDWNGGIHPCCYRVLDRYKGKSNLDINKIENEMLEEINKLLDHLITFVKPKKLLYIAIDGVAPRAKMNQQRTRRYKSIKEKHFINKMREKHRVPTNFIWDSNCITPGTIFMEKVTKSILDHINNSPLSGYDNIDKIISTSNVPMEGEHKIIQYIRENNSAGASAIYGLDADLIFLSMGLHKKDVFLLREQKFIRRPKKTEDYDKLVYLESNRLRYRLVGEIINMVGKNVNFRLYPNNIINDFIVMCYFFGNDFIPHIPCLMIGYNGIDLILDEYVKVLKKRRCYLVRHRSNEIDNSFLINLLTPISEQEETIFQKHYKANKYNTGEAKAGVTGFEKELYEYNHIADRKKDVIQLGKKGWKERYYKHNFGISYSDKVGIYKICHAYLEGIEWSWQYYYKGVPSWSWFYPYHHAPHLSDLVETLKSVKMNSIKFDKNVPLTPFQQLMSVLPPSSSHLVPNSYRNTMTDENSEISDFYPSDFEEDYQQKYIRWQSKAIVPFIEENRLKEATINLPLTKDETNRNSLGKLIIIKGVSNN